MTYDEAIEKITHALLNYREEPRSGQLWGVERAESRARAAAEAIGLREMMEALDMYACKCAPHECRGEALTCGMYAATALACKRQP